VQPLALRQVALVVFALQAVGVPVQLPEVDHEHPLAERQVVLVVLVLHAVGVPVHSWLVVSQVQPAWAAHVVVL
jgi:hypothetical protein